MISELASVRLTLVPGDLDTQDIQHRCLLKAIMAIKELADKWVLITGAASGIGLETAQAFSRHHANLILIDVNERALKEQHAVYTARGIRCLAFAADVADEALVHQVARRVVADVGAPHVLVNNAGIGFLGPLLDTPSSAWHQVLNVNVMGMVHVCQAFIGPMLRSGGPRQVVNVASAAGIMPAPNLSAYSASKHAVMGLSDALAMELAHTCVGVTVVCPGVINTPIVRNRQAVAAVVPDAQMDKIDAHYRKVGASPAVVGERIVRAVQTGEDIVLVGPTAMALFNVKRLSRSLARKATLQGCKANGYWWPYEPRH